MAERQGTLRGEHESFARVEAAALEAKRRHFRLTTPGERIEEAFDLNDLANEIREGVLRARARR